MAYLELMKRKIETNFIFKKEIGINEKLFESSKNTQSCAYNENQNAFEIVRQALHSQASS